MVGQSVERWAALWPFTTLCACIGLEKAGSTRLFSAPAVKHTSCTEYQRSRGMNGKMRVCRVENLARYAKREGSKSVFAFFSSHIFTVSFP